MLWFAVGYFWCQSSIDVSSNVCSYYLSFVYSRSLILINLNDERKIMVKNDYPGVLGGVEVN